MPKHKVIAIAFADLHTHRFKNFDNQGSGRLYWHLRVLQDIAEEAERYGVSILFAGDLLHNPKEVENVTMSKLLKTFQFQIQRRAIDFYGISGNHDMSEKNSLKHVSPSHLDSFSIFDKFHKMDIAVKQGNGFCVAGIPYFNNDQDVVEVSKSLWKKAKQGSGLKILMIHGDFPGAKTNQGFKVNETEYIKYDTFKRWDLVICGHIHKKQKLTNNVYMLGAPLQLDAGDEGNECGYWRIYDNGHMEFVELEGIPQFITLKVGETPPNKFHYYIAPGQSLVEEDIELGEFSNINDRSKLAKQYCKAKGIKSKSKKRALTEILNQPE